MKADKKSMVMPKKKKPTIRKSKSKTKPEAKYEKMTY